MRYLITGGAGFIGSHLAEALIERGHHVHVFDDLSTGQLANIEYLFGHERFESTIGDVLDRQQLIEVVNDCDQIFHLAALSDEQGIHDQPLRAYGVNLHGTENVLEVAARRKKKVMILSSSLVYQITSGEPARTHWAETNDWRNVVSSQHRWSLGGIQALTEYLALMYHSVHELSVVIVRLFDIVGPRQSGKGGAIIPQLIRQALRDEPMEVPGDGSQPRYFTYVGDAVWAMRRLMNLPGTEGRIYNVGTEEETRLQYLARKIRDMIGSSSEIVYAGEEEADVSALHSKQPKKPDISALRREIGYEPSYELEEILIEIITDRPAPWTIFAQ